MANPTSLVLQPSLPRAVPRLGLVRRISSSTRLKFNSGEENKITFWRLVQLPHTPAGLSGPPQDRKGDGAEEELPLHRWHNPTAGAACDNHWGGNAVSAGKVRSKTAQKGEFLVCKLKGVEFALLLRIQTKFDVSLFKNKQTKYIENSKGGP